MRKFVLFVIIIALLASMATTVYAAPPDGPPGLERAIEAQEAHTDRLLNIPGVVGTAVGFGDDGLPAVKIYTEKVGVAGLPNSLDGVSVEVVVTGRFYARDDPKDRQTRPVPIGVSTGHPDITAGTIGARVTDAEGNVYALSNNHVYANCNEASFGDSALQPGPYDGGTYPEDEIGTLYDWEELKFDGSENIMDAAIALSSTAELSNATLPDGYGVPGAVPVEADSALIGQAVQKYGRTTRLTKGVVEDINVTVNVCYDARGMACFKSAKFVGQIAITPGDFSAGGDSGSLIVTDDPNNNKSPVGLLFAGSSTHTIASPIGPVLDYFGVAIDSEPTVGAPTVSITSPTDGSFFHVNESITFKGTANDTEDDDLTASLVWKSSIDSQIGEGGSFSTTLSEGQHAITASVTDSDGNTGSASIDVVVVNDAPMVTILQPEDGATFDSGASITFKGTASDTEDGDLTASLVWTSDIDGQIGTGGSFYKTLSDGSHTITASVTDSGGKTGSSSISITVGAPMEPTTVSVSSISYVCEGGRTSDRHLLITVALIDDLEDWVADASVSIDVYLDGSPYGSGTGTTGMYGTVTFKVNNAPSGTYTTIVTDVTAEGLTWDEVPPDNNSFEKT